MAGEMEHPGKIWNRIETRGNKVLDRFLPTKAQRWFWGVLQALLSLLLALFTLQATLGVACINVVMIHYLTAERIISCGNAAVNPQNEGKLIKIQGKLTHSEPVHDPVLNVRIDVPCARRVFTPNDEGIHSLKTYPPILDSLRTGPSLLSTETSIGAYRILNHAHDVLIWDEWHAPAAPGDISLGTPAGGFSLTWENPYSADSRLQLRNADGVLLGTVTYRVPEPEEPHLYLIGRQLDGALDMAQQDTHTLYSAGSWAECDRDSHFGFEPFHISLLLIGLLIQLGLLYVLLGALRAAWWNLTRKADFLRFRLQHAALYACGILSLLASGGGWLILMAISSRAPSRLLIIGPLLLAAGLMLLANAVQHWRRKKRTDSAINPS